MNNNPNDGLMFDGVFTGELSVETGKRYVSAIADIDTAFGNYLYHIVESMTELSSDPRFKAYTAYTNRTDPTSKIAQYNEADPRQFLLQLRRKTKGQKKEDISDLPMIYFHRNAGFTLADQGGNKFQKDNENIIDDNNDLVAKIDQIPLVLTYSVYVLAWDTNTLDKLTLQLTAAMLTASRIIEYDTVLAGHMLSSRAEVTPAQLLMWSDASMAASDDRLLVNTTSFDLVGMVHQARGVKTSKISYQFHEPQFLGQKATL